MKRKSLFMKTCPLINFKVRALALWGFFHLQKENLLFNNMFIIISIRMVIIVITLACQAMVATKHFFSNVPVRIVS